MFSSHPPFLTSTPAGDPLDRFPYEIWVRCICLASYGTPYGPLPFLSVSRRWESAIIDEPEAWSYIEINQEKDIAARLSVFLYLSQSHLLDLQISLPNLNDPADIEALKDVLKSICHRIRSMNFSQETRSITATTLVEVLTDQNIRYPELKVVGFQPIHGQANFSPLLLISPKLRVASTCILDDPDVSAFCGKMQEVSVSLSDLDDVQILLERTSLTWLRLRHFHQNKCSPKLRGTFSQLETLSLHCIPQAINVTVFGAHHPYLNTLSLHLPTFMARWLISCLPMLPTLKILLLEHQNTRETFDSQPESTITLPFKLPLLEEFGLILSYADNSLLGELVPYICDSGILRDLERLSITLGRFHRYEGLDPLSSLLSAASSINNLTISSHRLDADGESPNINSRPAQVTMPMIDTLSIAVVEMLELIEAPNVESLEIRTTFEFFDADPALPTILNLPLRFGYKLVRLKAHGAATDILHKSFKVDWQRKYKWKSITHLTWSNRIPGIFPTATFLSSLTVLQFTTSEEQPHNGRTSSINYFLQELLRETNACPNLRAIELDAFPCWDLLFRVLSRRNADPNDTVSFNAIACSPVVPIVSITLPFLPVVPILRLLVKYLKGCDTEYFEIDIERTIRRRWTFPFFAVCWKCLDAGYICCFTEGEEYVEYDEIFDVEGRPIEKRVSDREMLALIDFKPDVIVIPKATGATGDTEDTRDTGQVMVSLAKSPSLDDWLDFLFEPLENKDIFYRDDCGRDKVFGPFTITASTPIGSETGGRSLPSGKLNV